MNTPQLRQAFCLVVGFVLPLANVFAADAAASAPVATTPAISAKAAKAEYSQLPDGTALYTLANKNGAVVKILAYGATIVDLEMPDRNGQLANVVLAPNPLANYARFNQSASVKGRVANRIAGASFTLDGNTYTLKANDGPNTLHGGLVGFDKVVWSGVINGENKDGDVNVKLTYISKDGEEGFPGTLTVSLTYTLTANNTLRLAYSATTDKPTPLNLTNHAYFNLAGGRGDSNSYQVQINADRYTVADAALIPTGEIKSVKDSPFDFTQPTALGAHADQLGAGAARHYDASFVLNRDQAAGTALTFAARVTEPTSGRSVEVWTNEPGLQLYTSQLNPPPAPASTSPAASAASASVSASSAASAPPATTPAPARGRGAGRNAVGFLTLETQHFPDAVHHDNFPSIILRPGETFSSITEYRFTAK
ncbi:MAG TPA: aldose epimerase family protein [Opitutales bacterium]|jgi:aldose 1-epimerase|nr:aldose epimerase family protein [Opitutales bacterium]